MTPRLWEFVGTALGRLLYLCACHAGEPILVWVHREGKDRSSPEMEVRLLNPALLKL